MDDACSQVIYNELANLRRSDIGLATVGQTT